MWDGNPYPTIKSPQRLILLLQHGLDSETEHRFKARTTDIVNFIPQYPFSPKTSRGPTMQHVFFSRQNTFYTHFKIPNYIKHELLHKHFRNRRHTHPFPYVGP
jgi:hypothetical protein